MNLIEIAGFLGADAEERFTSTGKRVVSLRVAARTRHNGKDDTIWWRVNIWGDRYDRMLPFLKKGSAVIVVGEMSKPEIYTAKDGTPQLSLSMTAEIIKFSPFGRPDRDQKSEQPQMAKTSAEEQFASYGGGSSGTSESVTTGDDLPF
ncbi:MAG: Single-stranded DNA-binding protein [Chlamydiales bacterium]|nr:Single-stranded DNA-binding protein [Chlamydiales bacterium]MCH9620516.1 Single-stranded DNA-binding protein [Chlamydiales bacterium]MCH9623501.1 Single-stranded DNA-binding protein [Chlamydiales bacterium]